MRKCDDGSLHEGKLELITWTTQDMGWGGCFAEESDDLKVKFEVSPLHVNESQVESTDRHIRIGRDEGG